MNIDGYASVLNGYSIKNYYKRTVDLIVNSVPEKIELTYSLQNDFGFTPRLLREDDTIKFNIAFPLDGYFAPTADWVKPYNVSYEELALAGIFPEYDLSVYSELRACESKFETLDWAKTWIGFQVKYSEALMRAITPQVMQQAWNRYLCESVVEL